MVIFSFFYVGPEDIHDSLFRFQLHDLLFVAHHEHSHILDEGLLLGYAVLAFGKLDLSDQHDGINFVRHQADLVFNIFLD